MKFSRIGSLIVAYLVTLACASAGPILDVQGPLLYSYTIDPLQYLAYSWTQTLSYVGVSVSATVQGTGSGSAYLMTAIGPGTTSASQEAMAAITYPGSPTDLTLFSGLTLGPGTYYLLLTGNTQGQSSSWSDTYSPTISTGPGVTRQVGAYYTDQFTPPAYAPDGVFTYYPYDNDGYAVMDVAGTPASVPEPSSAGLVFVALGILVSSGRRRRVHHR